MKCNEAIEHLLRYSLEKGLIEKLDYHVARNGLLELFSENEPFSGALTPLWEPDELPESPTEILDTLLDFGAEKGLIPMNTITYRDLLDARIMGILMPRQSELARKFYEIYEREGADAATEYFYDLSKASNYIRMDRIKKNLMWKSPTLSGDLEITINMSKPEKDPKEIELAAKGILGADRHYPKCLICAENAGYQGNLNHPARQNHRIIPFAMVGENWYLQYSPYSYYEEHCILLHEDHVPMKISEKTLARLLSFVEAFPAYFIGSNADLPIVGGSILTHEHYQAGRHLFPVDLSHEVARFGHPEEPEVVVSMMDWPISTVRVEGFEKEKVYRVGAQVLNGWFNYSDEELGIIAETTARHNTVTPIARRGEKGSYILNLILRNNRTNAEYPTGIFHTHADHQHMKKENIGLIEAMGLAILPGRLRSELEPIKMALMGKEHLNCPDMHKPWLREIILHYGTNLSADEADGVLRLSMAEKFSEVLEDCGVFKKEAKGIAGFKRFLKAVGMKERAGR